MIRLTKHNVNKIGGEEDYRLIVNGVRLKYCTYVQPNSETLFCDKELDWYKDLEDVLENWIIDGRKFKDIIIDPTTEIDGKDW